MAGQGLALPSDLIHDHDYLVRWDTGEETLPLSHQGCGHHDESIFCKVAGENKLVFLPFLRLKGFCKTPVQDLTSTLGFFRLPQVTSSSHPRYVYSAP